MATQRYKRKQDESVVIQENSVTIVTAKLKTSKGETKPHWLANPPERKLLVGFWEGPKEEFNDENVSSSIHAICKKLMTSNDEMEKIIGTDLYLLDRDNKTSLKAITTNVSLMGIWYICDIDSLDYIYISKHDKFESFVGIARWYINSKRDINIKGDREFKKGKDPHYRSDIYSPIRADSIAEPKNPPVINKETNKPEFQQKEEPKKETTKRKPRKVKEPTPEIEPEVVVVASAEIKHDPEEVIIPEVVDSSEETEKEEKAVKATAKVKTTKEEPVKVIATSPIRAIKLDDKAETSEIFFHIACLLKQVVNDDTAMTMLSMIFGDNTVEGIVIEKMFKSAKTNLPPNEIKYYTPYNLSSYRRLVTREINVRGVTKHGR